MESVIQIIISGLMSGGIYSLISVGLALIFGVIELVNFAHAEYLMVAMYISFWSFNLFGIDPYLSFPIVLAFMALLGFLTYQLVMRRLINSTHQIQMLATLSIMLILQNAALILWKADYRNVRTPYSTETINIGNITLSYPKVVAFIVALSVAIGIYLYLYKTFSGTAIRAISQNNKSAQLMGIKLHKTYCIAFTLGISMVAVAGVLLIPMYPAYPLVGSGFLLPAFIVVVIGGLSSIPGAIVAGLLVGVVESLSGYLFGPEFQQFSYFVLFLLVMIFKPEGILNRRKEGA